jgi:hypothetical protein
MDDHIEQVQSLLHEAAETHHMVYRITDGSDDDWATWYSDWLVHRSELPDLLGRPPVRSALTHALVTLDRQYTQGQHDQPWELFYAQAIVKEFA